MNIHGRNTHKEAGLFIFEKPRAVFYSLFSFRTVVLMRLPDDLDPALLEPAGVFLHRRAARPAHLGADAYVDGLRPHGDEPFELFAHPPSPSTDLPHSEQRMKPVRRSSSPLA